MNWKEFLNLPNNDNMLNKKPEKIVYSTKTQKQIILKIKKLVKKYFVKDEKILRVFLFGSLPKMNLGKYKKRYHGHLYSDIDLGIVVENGFRIRKDFKWVNRFPSCELYEYKDKILGKHPILVHVHNPRKDDKRNAIKAGMLRKDNLILYYRVKKK